MKAFKGNIDGLLKHVEGNQEKLEDPNALYYDELTEALNEMVEEGVIESYIGENGETLYKR